MNLTATAAAHPNLALVKYWGQRDATLNIPANGSISLNLSGATTVTTVTFVEDLDADSVWLNGTRAAGVTLARVRAQLSRVRDLAGIPAAARVVSHNDFPADAGMASSASGFAALSLAATAAAGLSLSPKALSVLARKGSGSACRSVPDGFVEWLPGWDDGSSYARSLAPCDHWDLRVVTVDCAGGAKDISSLAGHGAAPSSPFYPARLQEVMRTLDDVREAVLARDFGRLGPAVEREALSLHAIAMTSRPAGKPWMSGILYWEPETVRLLHAVQHWRREGLDVAFTLDAGPSVHLLCEADDLPHVMGAVAEVMPGGATPIISEPGRGAWLVKDNDGAEAPSDASCKA